MSTELVVNERRPYELTEKQLNIIANTEFVPKDKRGKMDVILASIFRGRALGIDDMTAIQEIHIVNGKPGESAALAAGLVRRAGHMIDGKVSSDGAIAHGKRADNGAELTVAFGPKEAKAAGLEGNVNYKKYPQSMYWARAVTQLCRSLFSDCFLGGVYTPEELGAEFVVAEDVIEHEAVPFDSGPLPESEEHAAQLGFGGLTEPVTETDSNASGGQAGAVGAGSVSSWADLKTAGATIGLTLDELKAKAAERFPKEWAEGNPDAISPLRWETFWEDLRDFPEPVEA